MVRGFIEQGGDSWHLCVYLGGDPATRKQRYKTQSVRGTKLEAQRALAELVVLANRGLLAQTSGTVGQLIEAWFEQAARDFSPKENLRRRKFSGAGSAHCHPQKSRIGTRDAVAAGSPVKRSAACHRWPFRSGEGVPRWVRRRTVRLGG